MLVSALLAAMSIAQIFNYAVTYDGVTFQANGVKLPDGSVKVDWADPYNIRSYNEARALAKPRPPAPNYGLVHENMRNTGYIATTPEEREYAAKARNHAIEADEDSPALHLTVIGTEAERKAVLGDFDGDGPLAGLKGRVAIQEYGPDEWAVSKDLGFRPGKPAIYLQDGKRVVLHVNDYSAGPDRLAEAIRKADPKYRPDLDPGQPGTAACLLGFTKDHYAGIAVTALALAFIWAVPITRKVR